MPAQTGVPGAAFVRSLAAAGSVALALVPSWPTAPSAAQRDALAPTACTVEPLTAEEIVALVAAATPAADPAGRVVPGGGPADPPALPQGEPADPETVAGVTAAALEFAGCRNTDDLPRRLALMTDRLAAEAAGSGDGDGQGGAATPVVEEVPAPTVTAVRVRDVGVLPDGRVGAVVALRAEGADGRPDRETYFHVFERVGDRWLLDEEIPSPSPGSAGPSTRRGTAPCRRSPTTRSSAAPPTASPRSPAPSAVEALLMVGFEDGDDQGGVGCEFFVIEWGARSVTASAFCRADEALVGRAAYLQVEAHGPRGTSDATPDLCEDVALLATAIDFACTVELPEPAP